MTASLYEADFYAWTRKQAALLRDEEWENLDWQQIAEEIESLGRNERREIKSRLGVLIMHLLKLEYQRRPWFLTRSWRNTIAEQRNRLDAALAESPTLRAQINDLITEAYPYAVKDAARETGLSRTTFPAVCPYNVEQLLDEEYWP